MIGNDSLDGRPWPVLCLDTDRTEVDCRARGTFDYLAAVGTGAGTAKTGRGRVEHPSKLVKDVKALWLVFA